MNELFGMLWIEWKKAIRSKMPLWTTLGSMFMPIGIAFLIFIARNPEIGQQLGIVGAKANIVAYATTDWPNYLRVYSQMIGAAGLILFILITSWIFGREFTDGTIKDLLAVPIGRGTIVIAKYIVMVIWSAIMTLIIYITGVILGIFLNLPGNSIEVMIDGSLFVISVSLLTVVSIFPFALLASFGRGFLLPIGIAVLMMMMVNLTQIFGVGEYFPWAIPMIYAMGKNPINILSYWIVLITGLAGIIGTWLWWKYADQHR